MLGVSATFGGFHYLEGMWFEVVGGEVCVVNGDVYDSMTRQVAVVKLI
jgi:hypothetical protein